MNIVCTPPPLFCWGSGVGFEPATKLSKRGGLTGRQFLEGATRKEGSDIFSGGLYFFHKK